MLSRFALFIGLALLASTLVAYRAARAQDIPSYASARSLAVGRSEIADPRDEWSPNPAMRQDTNAHLLTMLAPLPMNVPGTYTVGLTIDFPLDNGLEGGGAFTRYDFPDANFSWQSIGAQVSKTFYVSGAGEDARFASAGVRLRYGEQMLPPPYLPFEDITADLGATFDLLPQLTAGVSVTHLFSLYNNQGDSIEARTAWMGLTYRPITTLSVHGALEIAAGNSSPNFRGGIEYSFDPHLVLRAGVVSGTGEISAGFGVRTESFLADFSAIRHPDLGTLISFGIGFDL